MRSGLIVAEASTPEKPAEITATAAAPTDARRIAVVRSIGRRVSRRSVRYQCPRRSPSVVAPPIQNKTLIHAGTLSSPTTRAAW